MKKLLFYALAAMVSLQACDKSDDDQVYVSPQAKEALTAKYPNAKGVHWQMKNGYVVAEFSTSSAREQSAWFDNNGTWYMTETDILFAQLPEAVKVSFADGQYASWRVEDIDKIERSATETVYVIEVENKQSEVDLYYSSEGILVKEMIDVDDDYDYEDYIPAAPSAAIESYITTAYPNAKILDIDREGAYTEVEILDGRIKRELLFDKNDAWISTQTEIRAADVPEQITQVLKRSEYGSYRIDDVDFYQTPQGDYYRFELESGAKEVNVKITTDGVLTVVR